MQLFRRPPEPADFSKAVSTARDSIRKAIHETTNRVRSDDLFPPKWKAYRDYFAEAQSGKCGYCEIMVIGGQPGDVEHFYPKGALWALGDDPSTRGIERTWASTVEGRKHAVISEQGYWWRAYEWSNYLLACTVCNSYWKLSFFPVADDPRVIPPTEDVVEKPLLLNPFEDRDPSAHLHFTRDGCVAPKDDVGSATIETCGLDRESLDRSRREKAKRAYRLACEIKKADDPLTIERHLLDFFELGSEEYVHSGMVRTIFAHCVGLPWSELETLARTAQARSADDFEES